MTETKEKKTQRPYRGYTKKSAAPAQKDASAAKKEKPAHETSRQQLSAGRGRPQKAKQENTVSRKTPLKIISLGGLNEIGKNLTVFECSNDLFIVDCGLAFPDQDMLGVDLVIPDFTYLEKNKDKIRGIVITHGHEDHIGGIPYLLKHLQITVPIYATRLTLGLIKGKLSEHGLLKSAMLIEVTPRQNVKLGCMAVEFIRVNHSIPDSVGLAIFTPAGIVIHTGDFKVDFTPIQSEVIDLARFGELGNRGVLALMADSTNAERPGSTMTESRVGESLDAIFKKNSAKRIIIATFSSNIHRVQQIVDAAVKYGRKVIVSGRSMENVVAIASELGYLKIPAGTLVSIDTINKYNDEDLVIVTTGSQGEPMSALSRMSAGEHRKVEINSGDCIVISATPIPGNEKFVNKVINELMKLGADVVYESMYEVHVSGHACQDELKMMLGLTKPKFFIPVHGEYKHLRKHAGLAALMGIPEKNILISDIGRVIETDGTEMKITSTVPAGKVMVDGLGVGDVGSIVLRDRKHLAQDGLIVVVTGIKRDTGKMASKPEIVSRGFVYVKESEELIESIRDMVVYVFEDCYNKNIREWNQIKSRLKDEVSDLIYQKTKRNPMIIPILMDLQ